MQHGEGYMNDDLVLENCKDGLQNKVYTLLQDKCNTSSGNACMKHYENNGN